MSDNGQKNKFIPKDYLEHLRRPKRKMTEADYIAQVLEIYPGIRVWVNVAINPEGHLQVSVFDLDQSEQEPIYTFFSDKRTRELFMAYGTVAAIQSEPYGVTFPGFNQSLLKRMIENGEAPPGWIASQE